MYRLNISHTNADKVLQKTLDRIHGEQLVVGALGPTNSVEASIKSAAKSVSEPAFSLELVAHAADGVLALGDWTVDDQGTTVQALAKRLEVERSRFKDGQILLIGCYTAMTVAGQNAIRHLAKIFKTTVKGTTVPIFARFFDKNGIIPNAPFLCDDSNLPRLVDAAARMADPFARFEPQPDGLQSIRDRLRPETMDEAKDDWQRTRPKHRWPLRQLASKEQLQSCLDPVEPRVATAPGLLALPELELIAPIGDGGLYYRLTVLLGGHVVRIYPQSHPEGMLLRAPSGWLDQLPSGIPIE